MPHSYFIFLIIWFFFILIFNIFSKEKWVKKLKENIFFELFFNEWRVFSPSPIKSDIKIYCRDLVPGNKVEKLKELYFFSRKDLMSHRERIFLEKFIVTEKRKNYAYSLLKKYLKNNISSKPIKSRQICIVRTFGYFSELEDAIEVIDYV